MTVYYLNCMLGSGEFYIMHSYAYDYNFLYIQFIA